MDRLIYTAMTGAKGTMDQQAAVAHNLANVNSTGFRAELHKLRAVEVQTEALHTRAFTVDASVATDYTPGPLQHTGRPYDVAIEGKGWLAVWLAQRLFPADVAVAFGALYAAVVGHIWPVFHEFRGGKGAATLVGGLILLWPQALLPLLGVWLLCLTLTGYVGLSTVLAAISLLVSAAWSGADADMWWFAIASSVLLTFSHRSNLQRLRSGTENRFEKARLLGRLLSGRRG